MFNRYILIVYWFHIWFLCYLYCTVTYLSCFVLMIIGKGFFAFLQRLKMWPDFQRCQLATSFHLFGLTLEKCPLFNAFPNFHHVCEINVYSFHHIVFSDLNLPASILEPAGSPLNLSHGSPKCPSCPFSCYHKKGAWLTCYGGFLRLE